MTAITDKQNLQKALTYVKVVLWITDDDQDEVLSFLIKSANAMINKKTSIDLLNVSSVTEYFSWATQRQLFLSKTPIWTISSISYNNNQRWTPDWQAFDTDDYIAEDNWTVTFSFELYRGFKNIKAIYTTGFADFDTITAKYEDLKNALALIVWNLYNIRKQGWISSESVSWTSLVYDKKAITSDVAQILDQYLDVAI